MNAKQALCAAVFCLFAFQKTAVADEPRPETPEWLRSDLVMNEADFGTSSPQMQAPANPQWPTEVSNANAGSYWQSFVSSLDGPPNVPAGAVDAPNSMPSSLSPNASPGIFPTSSVVVKKRISILPDIATFFVATPLAYGALAIGMVANFVRGGLTLPLPDANDVWLLSIIPTMIVAGTALLIGLFDFDQRHPLLNILWVILGSVGGELLGIGAGAALGAGLFPKDGNLSGLIAFAGGPIFAVLGSIILPEILKPGKKVRVVTSMTAAPTGKGQLAFGPSLGFQM